MSDQTISELNIDEQESCREVRILAYDDFDFPDIDNEIDLSDIFDEEKHGIGDDEVLRIFERGAEHSVSRLLALFSVEC